MKHLTKEQRYVIASLRKRKEPLQKIANEIGVHKSTVSRELKRNASKKRTYNPKKATEFAQERKERFASNRRFTKTVEKRIRSYLETDQWSPEQIKGYCNQQDLEMVSTERIYQFICQDKTQGGRLYKHLRHRLKHRKKAVGVSKIRIKDRISIDQRPQQANNREEFGHFEMDLVIGKEQKGAILTLKERKTRHVFYRHLSHRKQAETTAKAVIETLLPYKEHIRSITTDNGTEFAAHKLITQKLKATVYFAHPYCSWEKGAVENANKLLRQYIPKRTIINQKTTQNLAQIQYKINNRPRKVLQYQKPFKLFYKFINQNVAFAS